MYIYIYTYIYYTHFEANNGLCDFQPWEVSIATEPLASPTFASSLVPNKIDIHTHTYVYIYIYVCVTHMYSFYYIINYTHTRTQTHTHTRTHTQTHIYIYLYIHSMIVVMHKYKNDQKCTTAPLQNVNWLQSPPQNACCLKWPSARQSRRSGQKMSPTSWVDMVGTMWARPSLSYSMLDGSYPTWEYLKGAYTSTASTPQISLADQS